MAKTDKDNGKTGHDDKTHHTGHGHAQEDNGSDKATPFPATEAGEQKHAAAAIASAVKAVPTAWLPFYLVMLLDAVLGYLKAHPELYDAVIQRILDWIHANPAASNALADALPQYHDTLARANAAAARRA